MAGTPSIMNSEATIEVLGIVVGDPQDWSVLLVCLKKKICNSFDDCIIPLYEFLFTNIGLWLSFSDFEVSILKHLKVSLSLLHLRSGPFMRVSQLCVVHKSWKPSLKFFFNLFYLVCTS